MLGSQMIYQSYHHAKNNSKPQPIHCHNSFTLITTALATSLDAMAIYWSIIRKKAEMIGVFTLIIIVFSIVYQNI